MRVKELRVSKPMSVDIFIQLANLAKKFESDIYVIGPNYKIDAKSLMGLLATLRIDDQITILTSGEDEEEAIKACIQFFK
ncbi:HPr family phosphocarrier protein [Metabacillus halosaccharovorans]|uniref:HPr family phosphocarrier protein n=1 Tax=Metabacillus halosaccharovorans TaxID=930124 RepID=UPI0009952EB8|nr:HPr family phosphocarrier protein [Metabacillus halosaccharovorans]